jgi:hypothetical protein
MRSSRGVVPVALVLVLALAAACARPPVAGSRRTATPVTGQGAGGDIASSSDPASDVRVAGPAVVSLDLVGVALLPPRAGRAGSVERLGGLSGCVNLESDGRILAVSDSRRDAFVVELDVRLGPPFDVVPGALTPLETQRGSVPLWPLTRDAGPAPPALLDAEALVALGSERLVVTSEGSGHAAPPGLFEYTRDGRFVAALPSPLPGVPGTTPGVPGGARDNLVFEGLAVLPGGRLIVSLEGPLEQDGPLPTAERGAWLRLFELVPRGSTWRAGRQLAYRFEPVAAGAAFRGGTISAGISDLLALDARRVLVLERAFLVTLGLPPRSDNRIRIVQIDLETGDDVAGLTSLEGAAFAPVRRDTVLDLDAIRGRLPRELERLENFEAMCLGPTLADGRRSLLLISDDNFNPAQRTAFLLFGLTDAPVAATIR